MNTEKTLTGIQCRNVVYLEPHPEDDDDYHLVKFTKYFSDGSKERCVQLKKNYEKTFWVSNILNRNHKQKKERFPLDKCDEVKSTRKNMFDACKRALDIKFGNPRPMDVLKGVYTFGTDLTTTAEIKYKFNQHKLAIDCIETADVAVFDVETNIRDKKRWEWIEMATLSFKDKVVTVVDKYFFENKYKGNIEDKLHEYDNLYLDSINKERNIHQEFIVVDGEWAVCETIFKYAHEWKPDFIVAWNMDYDINALIRAAKRAGKDIANLLSDPIVPKHLRSFKYYPGRDNMVTTNGTFKNLANFEKWPMVTCPASFVFADAMCFYYLSRSHKGKLPSVSLGAILESEFPHDERIRKMKFKEADHIPSGSPDWHIFMQTNYPFEYVIYNKFDCVGIEYLDERTSDISDALVSSCYFSDYGDYESEPRRLANEMHWDNLAKGYAYGTGGKNGVIPADDKLISKKDWIVTLRASLLIRHGVEVFEDASGLPSGIFIHGADVDVTSSYPNGNATMNTSVETLTKELIAIDGVSEQDRRETGLNYSGGFVNSLEISHRLFNLPKVDDVLSAYRNSRLN